MSLFLADFTLLIFFFNYISGIGPNLSVLIGGFTDSDKVPYDN
jgi:hypothetical protein